MNRKAKFILYRVRINRGGYTDTGYYYGIGQPVYCFCSADGTDGAVFRAANREAAKTKIRITHPTAEFYR
jgi:hypothetical protein